MTENVAWRASCFLEYSNIVTSTDKPVFPAAIRNRMHADGHLIFPVAWDENDQNRFEFLKLQSADGKVWAAAFTSYAEYEKGAQYTVPDVPITAELLEDGDYWDEENWGVRDFEFEDEDDT